MENYLSGKVSVLLEAMAHSKNPNKVRQIKSISSLLDYAKIHHRSEDSSKYFYQDERLNILFGNLLSEIEDYEVFEKTLTTWICEVKAFSRGVKAVDNYDYQILNGKSDRELYESLTEEEFCSEDSIEDMMAGIDIGEYLIVRSALGDFKAKVEKKIDKTILFSDVIMFDFNNDIEKKLKTLSIEAREIYHTIKI